MITFRRLVVLWSAMPTWKRIFLKALGIGAGIALIWVLAFATFIWYENRPTPSPTWSKNTITAKWIKAIPVKTDGTVKFSYALTNSSEQDYAQDSLATRFFVKAGDVLVPKERLGVPIYVPAKHTVRLDFFVKMEGYPDLLDASEDEVGKALKDRTPNLNGFELFDDVKHIEIILPPGWKETSKHRE